MQSTADVGGTEAAALEFMVVYAPESSLQELISRDALQHLFRATFNANGSR